MGITASFETSFLIVNAGLQPLFRQYFDGVQRALVASGPFPRGSDVDFAAMPTGAIVAGVVLVVGCASAGYRQEGHLAPNARRDHPVYVDGASPEAAYARWRQTIAAHVKLAMAGYPDAKGRYLAGLPPGETFFVTTILRDPTGFFEQVFILVDKIDLGMVTGRISSEIGVVDGFKKGQVHTFSESEVIDWVITRPDGSEEGNVVGRFVHAMSREGS